MRTHQDIDQLKSLGLLTAAEVRKLLGISQPTLSRLVKAGELMKLAHGLYAHPEVGIPPQDLDFAIACAKFGPKSAIGGLSALFFYGLSEQPPSQVWVLVPPDKADTNRNYRTIRTKTSLSIGIDSHDSCRMTSIERTILEALKYAVKIGPRVAIGAARKALRDGLTKENKLGEMAKQLKMQSVLERNWEAIIS